MKAWHVQEKDGEHQEIIFAETRTEAIRKSEAIGWTDYIAVRAKRAPYADGLMTEPVNLKVAQLENGWWFECHGTKCTKQITSDDKHSIAGDTILCETCTKKESQVAPVQTTV